MNSKIATTMVIGVLLAPVAVYAAEKSTTESVKEAASDTVITGKIKAEMAKDKTVDAIDITVDTDNKGVVTLSGRAKSKAQADQAVKIARETKGVTSVKNNITVGDTGMKRTEASGRMDNTSNKTSGDNAKEHVSDAVITTKIKAAYAKDKLVEMHKISVDTDDKGVVTLSGNAKSKAEADQAVKIARETKGVTSVKNNMMIAGEPAQKSTGQGMKEDARSAKENIKEGVADSVITVKIKAEYAKDKTVSMTNISVETEDKGVVTLGGTAKSKAEVDQAIKIARETKGVTSVKSNIKVSAAK